MADFVFAKRFLQDLAEWEARASPRDRDTLEQTLAQIGANPELAGRVPSYYDPERPSHLYRVGDLVIHYRVAPNDDVEFLNLFFPRT